MNKVGRIHWVDLLRSIAIISMVIFHFFYDLKLLELQIYDFHSGFWFFFGHFIRFIFIGLVGASLYLSYKKRVNYKKYLKHQLKRAFIIFASGMFFTLCSYLLFPDNYIRFGILHFIAVGIVIGALLIRNIHLLLIFTIVSFLMGSVVSQFILQTPLLMPFGVMYTGFQSLDYFPIFPWLSLILFGIIFAKILDSQKLLINPKWIPRIPILEKIGQKALLIYIIHQPILFGVIYIVIYFIN